MSEKRGNKHRDPATARAELAKGEAGHCLGPTCCAYAPPPGKPLSCTCGCRVCDRVIRREYPGHRAPERA